MRSSHSLDRLDVAFDGTQLVADAGLLLPATLAQHLGLKELVEEYLDLGKAAGPGERRRQGPARSSSRRSRAATASTTRPPCAPAGRRTSSASR